MGRGQAVRHWILIPAFPGSNPGGPANPFNDSQPCTLGQFFQRQPTCRSDLTRPLREQNPRSG